MPTTLLLAGQSNALGFGMSRATLPPHLSHTVFNYGQTYIWNGDGPYWGVLQPGYNTGTPANPEAWGPEVAFAYNFRREHPDDILFIIKSVKGETGLAYGPGQDWSPLSDNELFDLTTTRINAAKASMAAIGIDATPDVLLWVQGETDAMDALAANNYAANLGALLDAADEEWLAPGAEIILSGVRLASSLPYAQQVNDAVRAIENNNTGVFRLCTHALRAQADNIHLAADSHVSIGTQAYSIWDAWNWN